MNTHRHGDRFGTFQRRWLRSIAPALLLILAPTALLANPTGGSVVAGSATITTSGSTLNVNTGSAQTIINWQDFGIAAGEITNINQPNSSSTTLNRVLGGNVSEIYGTLNSNGNVILVNPNGVLVGAGGVVNTQGSFLASTLNLSDSDFLSGNYHLTGNSTASVTNLGQITSGGKDIFLIAQHVSNSGSLTAHNGTVGLAAGNDVSIAQSGDQRLSVALDSATVARNGTGIDNQGTIEAVKAELVANGNIYSLAVNNGGIVRATGAGNVGGQVWLLGHGGTVKNTGTIVASNADGTGGAIETSGDDVSIAGVVQTGAGGSWLIDPATLIIDAGAASTLATALDGGTNVTQQATSVVELDSALAWSGAGVLTLDAGTGSIVFNASLTSSGSGGLAFVYGSGYTLNSGAAINLSTASSLTINGQAYTVLGDVASLVAAVNGNAAGYYALGSNATASGTYTASAIASLSGAIDGLGHAIGGFTLSASSGTAIGFVGTNTGTIRNLALSNVSVTFADSLAGSSAYIGGLVGYSTGTLSGVSVSGTLSVSASNSTTTPYVLPRVGGLAGYSSGTVSNASASASISVSGSSRGVSMMVAGLIAENTGTITGSSAAGTVSASNGSNFSPTYAGGLVASNDGTISASHSDVAVTATGGGGGTGLVYVGGLAGYSASGASITGSYATGAVSFSRSAATGAVYVGGLVGQSSSSIASSYATGNVTVSLSSPSSTAYAAGLVGYNTATITNSHATGDVSATWNGTGTNTVEAGGLAGYSSGILSGVWATGNVTAYASSSDATGFAYAAGLVGYDIGSIAEAYAAGNASATANRAYAGGLTAYFVTSSGGATTASITDAYALGNAAAKGISPASGTSTAYAGGLSAYVGGKVTNAYAMGTATASGARINYAGGIAGFSSGSGGVALANYSGVYWNTETSGTAVVIANNVSSAGTLPTGLTTAQMGQSASYSAAFLNAFQVVAGAALPYLSTQSLVYGTLTGDAGTISATVNGAAAVSGGVVLAGGSYYLILNSVLGAGDVVVVSGTTASAATAAVSTGPVRALAALRGRVASSSSSDATGAGLGSGPTFTLPNGGSVTIPTSAFSPVTSIPNSAPAGAVAAGGGAGPGASAFGGGASNGDGGGGALASSSGVAYADQ